MPISVEQREITLEQQQWGATADRLLDLACPAVLNLLGLPDNLRQAIMKRLEKGWPKEAKASGEFTSNDLLHRHYRISYLRKLEEPEKDERGQNEVGLREELHVQRTSQDFETKKEIREGFSLWAETTSVGLIGEITYGKSTEGVGMSLQANNRSIAVNIEVLAGTL